jgi:hypothetical protein
MDHTVRTTSVQGGLSPDGLPPVPKSFFGGSGRRVQNDTRDRLPSLPQHDHLRDRSDGRTSSERQSFGDSAGHGSCCLSRPTPLTSGNTSWVNLIMSTLAIPLSPHTQGPEPVRFENSSFEPALVRKILLIEPNISLLSAETGLLNAANYCVTPAFSHGEVFVLRSIEAVALAIISDSLGSLVLGAVAMTVRSQWPLARILIIGRAATMLEDQLYDEQVEHSVEPKQLVEDIDRLYKDCWNQRSNTIAWKGGRSCSCLARPPIPESDPTKARTTEVSNNNNCWGTPSDILYRTR